ncbi:T9SS type A sorting domain-containing protein [Chryseobacterium indoltheticum]|uniref:Por secretion system C-terminal sorting domain n=1 Tax=Chryseobacterium indoltheticum TaxID=254 RepID=A0A381F4A0_9FLAO|nr:T9SS type A sorting domain-containing protein [Chryseobacterium indoltheticum]AZA74935.1 T9SS C-terminal target domain-containing protein [Chryseobacterium indoltheticum]SIQ29805.1 Por secretion system C-terminal sorting domain-containing protein [Chryseobacterium indoltheticum]SUX41385.1 Por secretion system C-terminal sorting domain [Chryseobacterium indoltheticum]
MKKILFLLLLIKAAFLWGQGGQAEYKFELYNLRFEIREPVKNNTSSNVTLTLKYEDNSEEQIYYRSISEEDHDEWDWNLNPPLIRSKRPVSIRVSGFVNFRSGTDASYDITNSLTICPLQNFSVASNSSRMSEITFKTRVTPVHSLVSLTDTGSTNTFLPSDDKIHFYARQGFAANLYGYQYSVDNVNWVDINSSLSILNKLSISAKDLFGSNYSQYIGQNIYFRVASCLSSGVYQAVSPPVILTLVKSAPHILTSSVTPTKCFDTIDGTATLNFDRTLLAGETLKISLVNTVTGAAVFNQDITNDLQTIASYTLQNLPPGTYKLDILGTYNGNATYTDSPTHTINFEITKPTPVTFDMTSKTDVYCFQGNDGIINITVGGGQNQYQYIVTKNGQPFLDWTNFTSGQTAAIQNLSAGIYKIQVRDSNMCIAKDPSNSSVEKEITITITQPSEAIALPAADIEIAQPSGYGLGNGYISVRVTGGTPNTNGSYNFEWRKDTPNGAVISTGITTDAVNNPYTIKLANLPAGNYYLTVKDKNYADASTQLGNCGIISQEFIVEQPQPLVVTIEVERQISCNISNDYPNKLDLDNNGIPDEAEDGNLKAVVTGGVGAYEYQWQVLAGGTFQDIPGATQAILSNRSVGNYKVLINDINSNMTNAEFTFAFPPQLSITLSANTISCYNQNTGMVSVDATGGTGMLSYQWNTSHTTPTVTGLPGGNYFVLVTDSKNCKVKGNVQIIQPDQVIITDMSVQNPICFGASNGEIKTNITGGEAPYSILWSNGATTADNIGIPAGNYMMTVTDANGCISTKQYILIDPLQLTVDLGADVTLCSGDTQVYTVAVNDPSATYLWEDQNGNIIGNSSTITLSAAGTYTVTITDSKGCIATDSVKIKNSCEVLNPQFLLATHAYSEASVVLVNTSPTQPQAVEWIVPTNNNIQVIQKTNNLLELKFSVPGTYEIGLKGIQGECVKTFYKKVIVEENTSGVTLNPTKASNITEFTILPNPNNGVFKILVGLGTENSIKIRIMDMVSHEVFPAVMQPKAAYFVVPFNTSLPAGTYLVILETGNEVLVKRMLVQ